MFKQRKLKHNRKHPNGSEQFSSSPSAQLDCHCLFGVLQELNSHFFSNGGCLDLEIPFSGMDKCNCETGVLNKGY